MITVLCFVAGAAQAQTPSPWSGSLGLTTDYVRRGSLRGQEDVEATGSLEYTRGSFYAIDRNSPTREGLEEEDILEVPGRRGARLQDAWDGLSPGQELEPWSTPTYTDL